MKSKSLFDLIFMFLRGKNRITKKILIKERQR